MNDNENIIFEFSFRSIITFLFTWAANYYIPLTALFNSYLSSQSIISRLKLLNCLFMFSII